MHIGVQFKDENSKVSHHEICLISNVRYRCSLDIKYQELGSSVVSNSRKEEGSLIKHHSRTDLIRYDRRLITNSSDRVLRQFVLPIYPPPSEDGAYIEQDLEPTHRFSDPITRTAWHATSFSPDGEWLAGGAADPSGHKIYIWDLSNDGQFVTALDGGREPLTYVHVSVIRLDYITSPLILCFVLTVASA